MGTAVVKAPSGQWQVTWIDGGQLPGNCGTATLSNFYAQLDYAPGQKPAVDEWGRAKPPVVTKEDIEALQKYIRTDFYEAYKKLARGIIVMSGPVLYENYLYFDETSDPATPEKHVYIGIGWLMSQIMQGGMGTFVTSPVVVNTAHTYTGAHAPSASGVMVLCWSPNPELVLHNRFAYEITEPFNSAKEQREARIKNSGAFKWLTERAARFWTMHRGKYIPRVPTKRAAE